MRSLLNIFKKIKFKNSDIPEPSSHGRTSFQERYTCFQKLLSDNNSILEIMGDMEEKLSGDHIFDMHYVDSRCDILVEKVHSVIENLNGLSNRQYLSLYDTFEEINSVIQDSLIKKSRFQ